MRTLLVVLVLLAPLAMAGLVQGHHPQACPSQAQALACVNEGTSGDASCDAHTANRSAATSLAVYDQDGALVAVDGWESCRYHEHPGGGHGSRTYAHGIHVQSRYGETGWMEREDTMSDGLTLHGCMWYGYVYGTPTRTVMGCPLLVGPPSFAWGELLP